MYFTPLALNILHFLVISFFAFNPSRISARTSAITTNNTDSTQLNFNKDILGILFFLFSLNIFSQTSEVMVSVNWPSWSSECKVEIYNPSGTLLTTIDNGYTGAGRGSYSTSVNIGCLLDNPNSPNGTGYYVIAYELYGDGWNGGGTLDITSGGVNVLAYDGDTGTLNNGGSGEITETLYFEVANGGAACVPAPEINIQGGSPLIDITSGNTAISTTDGTDFGSVYYLNGSVTNTFTIENLGTTDLDISSLTSSNALFAISNITIPQTIVSGNAVTFDITFNPSTVSIQTSTITINNTDSNENPYTFNVQGQGVDYCTSNGNTTYNTGVTLVSFNTINNSDTNNQNTGYEDFTAISTSVTQNSSYDLTVNVDTDGNYTVHSFVWIDWNQDGDFADVGEEYDLGAATNVSDGATSLSPLSITIPATAALGSTRMRVSARYNSNPTSCGTGFDGEVEDYTVNIVSSSPLPEINLVGNGNNITNGDLTVSALNNTDYGDIDTGNTVSNTFTIENIGNADLTIGATVSLATGALFAVTSQPSITTITAGNTTTFTIAFSPIAIGTFTDVVTITNNDSNENPYTFTISGNGLAPLTSGPGGVTNSLKLWLKSTAGLGYTDGQPVSLWTDQGRGSNATVNTPGQEPTYRDNATYNVNFNPVVDFDSSLTLSPTDGDYSYDDSRGNFLEGTSGFYTQDIFMVLIPDATINSTFGNMDLFCGDENLATDEEDVTGIGFGMYSVRFTNEVLSYAVGTSTKTPPYVGYGVSDTGTTNNYNNAGIINTRNNIGISQQELYYNATNVETVQNDIPDFSNVNDSRYWIGRSEGYEAATNARILEIITYSSRKGDASLTDERNKIQSYLAIKYGITLGVNGTSQDYVDSSGTVIWDIDTGVPANDIFNYDIAGIGRDDVSELNQKQSKSVNTVDDITIGLTNIYATNNLNTNSFLTDKDFLVWGNDNKTLAAQPAVVVDMSSGISELTTNVDFTSIGRTWKVVEKGAVGTAKVSIPESMLSSTLTPPGDYLMLISNSPTFSPTSEYRIMTLSGSNLETTYDFNGTKYITFGYAPEKTFVRSIYFDGVQNYMDAGNVLNLNSTSFTLSAWIKRNNTNSSIVSKRDNSFTSGYDFKINNAGNLEMSWVNGASQTITSSVVIPSGKWHHVAIIYNGTIAKLYIDGILDTTKTLSAPVSNSESFLIAAADGNEINTTAFFNGNIDEVRIWSVALSEDELRYVMNQEIEGIPTLGGVAIPNTFSKNEFTTISWNDLVGYYPMSTYTFTNCKDKSNNGYTAALKNISTVDCQTAPLPYKTISDGDWDVASTWENNTVQYLPNSVGLDGVTKIDWNIVETYHNVSSGDRDITVLGMVSDTGTLTIADPVVTSPIENNDGQSLTVTHYLELDGSIDLVGESQLLQGANSILDNDSGGFIERDQQGTANSYNYNYWSSSVSPISGNTSTKGTGIASVNSSVSLSGVLKDGTTSSNPQNITFNASYNSSDGAVTTPITISSYWLYKFNGTSDDYYSWVSIDENASLLPGEGFTMKGTSGTSLITDNQNYVFKGKPNNGDITLPIALGNDRLIGNPYPSAIDANEFILDNISVADGGNNPNGTIFNGALYFWDHFGQENSHNLGDYIGGYATRNLTAGVAAISNDARINTTLDVGTKIPGQFIPVNQAFFVLTSLDASLTGITTVDGGNIVFNNGQRVFAKETTSSSVFMKGASSKTETTSNNTSEDTRPIIRLLFHSPKGYNREIVVGIDKNATNSFDLGYDAPIADLGEEDMFWIFNESKFVIQAVNNFNEDQELPLGLIINETGLASIKIDELRNIEENIEYHIKDKLTGEIHNITENPFEVNLEAGEYYNRFSLIFQLRTKVEEETSFIDKDLFIYMNNEISELQINKNNDVEIQSISLFNYLGQQVNTWKSNINERFVSLPIQITTGVYIVRVNTKLGIITKKIIIE